MPPDEPETVITPDTGATVIVTSPANPEASSGSEEIQRIASRLEEIDAQIRQGIDGERQWTETNLSALRQEVADLRATLEQAAQNLPSQMQTLREELTQQLQELRDKLAKPQRGQTEEPEVTTVVATVIPPLAPESVDGTSQIAPVNDALPNEAATQKRKRKLL